MDLTDYGVSNQDYAQQDGSYQQQQQDYGQEASQQDQQQPYYSETAQEQTEQAAKPKYSIDDFELGKIVGEGAYGQVRLSTIKATGETVAIKSVNREQITKLGKERHIFREKDLLNEMDHPFIIKLLATTIDEKNLYFVFENCGNGDLANMIAARRKLHIDVVRLYAAQLVQGLDYLQAFEIMHRDLKPQNLLLDEQFNIKFIDFGDAKKESEEPFDDEIKYDESTDGPLDDQQSFLSDMMEESKGMDNTRRGTFVGTVNYLAPEMVKESQSSMASDLWALGCIIFKMVTGKVPFPGTNITTVYPLILNRQIDWPTNIEIDPLCKDLIDKLLQMEPTDRLGCFGTEHNIEALKAHPFFEGIDFRYQLINLGIKELLDKTAPQDLQKQPSMSAAEAENSKFAIPADGKPVLIGNMLKKNRYFMQQERKFELYANGEIKYFHGTEQKGMMVLTNKSRARKVSKASFEIMLPDAGKTYILIQCDLKKCPPKSEQFSCDLDDWVDAVNFVISLQNQ